MDDVNFSNIIETLLKEGKTRQVLTLFEDEIKSDEICNNSWDLIPIIARYLNKDTKDENVETFACCRKLMDLVTTVSKPEEVLLQFIEEIETAEDDVKFVALLKPLEKVLLKLPDKRITSLAWCFNAIKTYLLKLEVPDDFSLTNEERLLLDSSSSVIRIINLFEELLTFSDTISQEFSHVQNIPLKKQVLGKFFIELLGQPLAYLDMEMYKKSKPRARLIAEHLGKKSCIIRDPFVFLDMPGNEDGSDLIKPNDLSLGVYYYLILHEQVCLENVPKVYNSIFVLHNSLKLITQLLAQECQFTIEKGVHLAAAILKSVNRLQLPYLLLDSGDHSKFCTTISNVIVHNESETIRKEALQVLHNYLWSFEHQGRYFVIFNLIPVLGHSGLKGYLIMQYKEMLTEQLRVGKPSKYYHGNKLFELLSVFTYLKQKEETDMVDESDQIVSTLNLLRYLVLADKKGDTYIDWYLGILEEGYLKFLKTGIELSREHYFLKVKEIYEERDCQVSVTVSGRNLLEMPNDKKLEILNMSLTTLDVIDSLLSRVTECIRIRSNYV